MADARWPALVAAVRKVVHIHSVLSVQVYIYDVSYACIPTITNPQHRTHHRHDNRNRHPHPPSSSTSGGTTNPCPSPPTAPAAWRRSGRRGPGRVGRAGM